MAADEQERPREQRILEDILETVTSIDSNVEEILDRLGEHLDDIRYRQDWAARPYGGNSEDNYESE